LEDGWKFPGWLTALVAMAVAVCIVLAFIAPPPASEPSVADQPSASDRAREIVREIESALENYAVAHSGRYPEGKSSTEVFQKLLDEHFVKDPRLFYLEMSGKAVAGPGALAPDNVAFDVTVPVVFSTGYRIEYKPGGQAVPLPGHARPDAFDQGILVAYPGHKAFYRIGDKSAGGAVKEVVPSQAQIGAGPFTQLTPDGPLTSP
jgi:hypothetical protein